MGTTVSIVIALSAIWSVVSALIEKNKAKAKRALALNIGDEPASNVQLVQEPVFTVNTADIKVEALRRRAKRKKPQAKRAPLPAKTSVPLQKIKQLHEEDCPVPPTQYGRRKVRTTASQIAVMFQEQRNLRTAIVLAEVLGKPVSQR